MKNLIPAVFALALFLTSCKDNEPTAPEDNETPTETLAETTIGPEGGILETEDFKLTVPGGAFTTSAELKLYTEPEEAPFGEFSVSKLFRIEGIPGNYQTPLKVRMKYSGTLSGITFITVGIEDTVDLLDTTFVDIVFDLIEAEETDGFLTCEIPILQNNETNLFKYNSDSEIIDFFVGAMTKGKKWNPFGDHFEVNGVIPESEQSGADEILSFYEQAYERFKNAGFLYSGINWPMKLNFIKEPKNDLPTSIHKPDFHGIKIQYRESIEISDFVHAMVDVSFLFEILKTYNFTSYTTKILSSQVANWAGFKYAYALDSQNFIKKAMQLEIADFRNTHRGLLFEYLANRYGENILSLYCRDIKYTDDHIFALIHNTEKHEKWLYDFYQYLITSEKFSSEIPNDFWINHSSKIYIDSEFEKIVLPNDYNDLSAKWFHISLSDDLSENSTLKFSLNNNQADVSVIKYLGTDFQVIDHSLAEITITDVQNIADESYDLYVIVTNNYYSAPYKQTTNIELTIEQRDLKEITGGYVALRKLDVKFLTTYQDGNTIEEDGSYSCAFFKGQDSQVSFDNNILTQSYNFTGTDGIDYSGSMEIKFNDDQTKIINFTANAKLVKEDQYYGYIEEYNLSGHDIEYSGNNKYFVYGPETCDKLSTIYYSKAYTDDYEKQISEVVGCNDESELEIEISTR